MSYPPVLAEGDCTANGFLEGFPAVFPRARFRVPAAFLPFPAFDLANVPFFLAVRDFALTFLVPRAFA